MSGTTVVLDLDGTLLDTRDRHYACYCEVVRRLGGRPLQQPQYWRLKRSGLSLPTLLLKADILNPSPAAAQQWMRIIEAPSMLRLDRLQPGARAALRSWRSQGIRLRLVSMRQFEARALRQLEELGIAAEFSSVSFAGRGRRREKRSVARRLPVGGDLVWVGDTEEDALAGRAAKADVWLVSSGLRSMAFLQRLAVGRVVHGLREVRLLRGPALRTDRQRPGRTERP